MDQGLRALRAPSASNEEKHAALLPSEDYIILNLYNFSQDAITAVLSKHDIKDSDTMTREWRNVRETLRLWGNMSFVMEGKLDQMFIKTPDAQNYWELTCDILCMLGITLSLSVKLIEPPWSGKDVLGNIIPTVMSELKEDLEVSYESYSGDIGESAQGMAQSAQFNVDTLFRILPNIEESLRPHYPLQWGVPSVRFLSTPSNAKQRKPPTGMSLFQMSIRKKFPGIAEDLVVHLAELNWERLLKIHHLKSQCSELLRPTNPGGMTKLNASVDSSLIEKHSGQAPLTQIKEVLISDKSRTYNATLSISGFPLSTHPLSPPPLSTPPTPTPSVSTTFGAVDRGSAIGDLSAEYQSPETSFNCPICYAQLEGIQSGEMWKKHALKDLQPYSCTFSSCQESNITFDSTDSWISHEFAHHRGKQVDRFVCRKPCNHMFKERSEMLGHVVENHLGKAFSMEGVKELVDECKKKVILNRVICLFCQDEIEETKPSVQSHIGAHLDEIALTVLPLDIDILSQIIDRSINPHNPPITRDREDAKSGAVGLKRKGASNEFRKHLEECRNSIELLSNRLKNQLGDRGHEADKANSSENSNPYTKQLKLTNTEDDELSTGKPEETTNGNNSIPSTSQPELKPTLKPTLDHETSAESTGSSSQ
ncbi:hypothetical protein HOY80DRAFT_1048697 [Tuber brumale]|nr:hypothetical protein HOY80DRAFT_1048697 [Tuber brumale]